MKTVRPFLEGKIEEELFIKLRVSVEKLEARERQLKKARAKVNELKSCDKVSQDLALNQLIQIEDNYELIYPCVDNYSTGLSQTESLETEQPKESKRISLVARVLSYFKTLLSSELHNTEELPVISNIDFITDEFSSLNINSGE